MDFPSSPTLDQEFSSGGANYRWVGYGWALKPPAAGSDSPFVLKSGDIMTGPLTVTGDKGFITLNRATNPDASGISLQTAGKPHWTVEQNRDDALGDWTVNRFDDSGIFIGQSLRISRASGTFTMPNFAAMSVKPGSWTMFTMDKLSGYGACIQGRVNGNVRWQLAVGDQTAEGGGNTGSNFTIARMNDAGVYVDSPFTIDRSNGNVGVGSPGAYVYTYGDVVARASINMQSASPTFYIDGTAVNQVPTMRTRRGPNYYARWNILWGSDTEQGGNTGAHWYLGRYADAGGLLDYPILAFRDTGHVQLSQSLWATGYMESRGGRVTSRWTTGAVVSSVSTSTGTGMGFWHSTSGDVMLMGRCDANGFANSPFAQLNGVNFILLGTVGAWKLGGGPWSDNSDERIKNIHGNYERGLDAIKALQPVRYSYKGNDTDVKPSNRTVDPPPTPRTVVPEVKVEGDYVDEELLRRAAAEREAEANATEDDEPVSAPYPNSRHYQAAVDQKELIGLIAQSCEDVMPEMVFKTAGMIDGQPVTDLRAMDTGPLIFALVNAVKELAARVETLEAA